MYDQYERFSMVLSVLLRRPLSMTSAMLLYIHV